MTDKQQKDLENELNKTIKDLENDIKKTDEIRIY